MQFIDQVCCAGPADSCEVVGDGRDPQLQLVFSWTSCCSPVVCNNKCPWSMTQCSSLMVVNVPLIMRDSGSAPDSGHRELWWTLQLATETGIRLSAVAAIVVFDAFCVIFRAPLVVPELSASFSSFRALTTARARGLQGCRSRRNFTPR